MAFHCDGTETGPGGAFQGHMLPGMLFVVWSLHWLQGSMRAWFSAQRAGVPFESQPYYNLPGLPHFPYESLVKVIMSVMGALLELTMHDDGFQYLICGAGTLRAGHLDGDHVNNWQHLQMYMCFAMSGVVDLVGWAGVLPPGAEKAFLSLAFAGEALLMGLHSKEEPLDRFLHQALAVAMVGCCIACAAEAHWPSSYMATGARICFTMAQGALFIIIAHLMFEGRTAWDFSDGDQAPFQYSKVMVTQMTATILSCYIGLHVAVQGALQYRGKLHTGTHLYSLPPAVDST